MSHFIELISSEGVGTSVQTRSVKTSGRIMDSGEPGQHAGTMKAHRLSDSQGVSYALELQGTPRHEGRGEVFLYGDREEMRAIMLAIGQALASDGEPDPA